MQYAGKNYLTFLISVLQKLCNRFGAETIRAFRNCFYKNWVLNEWLLAKNKKMVKISKILKLQNIS